MSNPKIIGDIISISKGKKHNQIDSPLSNSRRYIQIDDLRNDDNIKSTNDIKGVEVNSQDIIIAWDGANAGTIGFNLEGYIGSTLARLRIDDQFDFDTVFLAKYLQSKFTYLRRTATGATIPHINRKALEKIPLPQIGLENQKRIAKVLSDCETLIQKRKESIELLDEFLKSTFLEMFGDPINNEKGWSTSSLEDFIDQKRGISYGIVQRGENIDVGVPVVRIRDIIANTFEENDFVKTAKEISDKYKRTILHGGEFLISIRGTVGKLAIAPDKSKGWNISREVAIIPVLDDINHDFLLSQLESEPTQRDILKNVIGVAQSGINLAYLRKLKIIIPDNNTQEQYSSISIKVKELIHKANNSLKELENLYRSLSQKAFKGELDLSMVDISIIKEEPKPEMEPIGEERWVDKLKVQDYKVNLDEIIKNDFGSNLFSIKNLEEAISNRALYVESSQVKSFLKKAMEDETIEQVYSGNTKQVMFKIKE